MNLKVHPDLRAEWNNKTMQCAVGRAGFTLNKREGDGATPIGIYPVREAFYRADRIPGPMTKLKCRPLSNADGWCDDDSDALYNQHVSLPYKAGHEKMMRQDGLYDLVVVIGYNDDPVVVGLGSAIFLHVAAPDFSPTEGCVSLARDDLVTLVGELQPGDGIEILPNIGQ